MTTVVETITHPWRNPVDYMQLVFWFVVFIFAAWALLDGLRLFANVAKEGAAQVIS